MPSPIPALLLLLAPGGPIEAPEAPEALSEVEASSLVYKNLVVDLPADPTTEAVDRVCSWSRRWMDAEYACALDRKGRVEAVAGHRDRMRELGRSRRSTDRALLSYRMEAERWLFNAQAEPEGPIPAPRPLPLP